MMAKGIREEIRFETFVVIKAIQEIEVKIFQTFDQRINQGRERTITKNSKKKINEPEKSIIKNLVNNKYRTN